MVVWLDIRFRFEVLLQQPFKRLVHCLLASSFVAEVSCHSDSSFFTIDLLFLYKCFENFLFVINILKFYSHTFRCEFLFSLSCLTLCPFNLEFCIFFIPKKFSVIIPSNISFLRNLYSHSGSKACDPNHYTFSLSEERVNILLPLSVCVLTPFTTL